MQNSDALPPQDGSEAPPSPHIPPDDVVWAFRLIRRAVQGFGSAHDARDRGYDDAAEKIDAEGVDTIRHAFTEVPQLKEALPRLHAMLDDAKKVADGGFEIEAELLQAEKVMASEPADSAGNGKLSSRHPTARP
ncbi:hypothetical protein DES53_102658 [Roseimicrobium gellanilyticum]|uniref:Uncharacterized protein n=1 Tax=Roseimicrobium gellanilyticum TaxID=748857 RepID=A0A366HRG7_9BACT|nr:hypothetical protein [Roseimicrobium gellanilyticum]RBP46270.1 hypothetical protein DES53_102658 [Roseimicrobium gellanilyticum]